MQTLWLDGFQQDERFYRSHAQSGELQVVAWMILLDRMTMSTRNSRFWCVYHDCIDCSITSRLDENGRCSCERINLCVALDQSLEGFACDHLVSVWNLGVSTKIRMHTYMQSCSVCDSARGFVKRCSHLDCAGVKVDQAWSELGKLYTARMRVRSRTCRALKVLVEDQSVKGLGGLD